MASRSSAARRSCSARICISCAAKDVCVCAASADAHEGNPVWSFSMVSEPFSVKFYSPTDGRVSGRLPSSDMTRLLALPFLIRDRWRYKEVGPYL